MINLSIINHNFDIAITKLSSFGLYNVLIAINSLTFGFNYTLKFLINYISNILRLTIASFYPRQERGPPENGK